MKPTIKAGTKLSKNTIVLAILNAGVLVKHRGNKKLITFADTEKRYAQYQTT